MQPHERYHIIEQIAKGDFATVYRARDLELNREVAIKQIHQQYLDDPAQLERYWQEAQLLASLEHPNILTIYDIVRERGWLVLELMKGGLQQQLRGQPIDVDFLRLTLIYTLHALHFLHQNGIVHGDVKPGNLLLDKSDRVKLGDFGIARRITGDDGSLLKGTTKYMAPEVVSDQFGPVGPHSDLYSLGFSAYELICGDQFDSLFPGLNIFGRDQQMAWMMWHAALDRRAPEINRVLEGVPQDLVTVIEKLTQKDPAKRYRTAEEAVSDLRTLAQLADQSPAEVEAARALEEARKTKRRRVLAIAAVAISTLCSVGIALLPGDEPAQVVVKEELPSAGTLEHKNLKRNSFQLSVPGRKESVYVEVNPQDDIFLNNVKVELKDLKLGDAIAIKQYAAGGKSITATRPLAVNARGRIVSLDAESRKIQVAVAGANPEDPLLEIYVPTYVEIELNQSKVLAIGLGTGSAGRDVAFEDLKMGDDVSVEHAADGEGRKATSLAATRLTKSEGYVIAVDTEQRKLKLRMGPLPNAPVLTLPLADVCPITLNRLSEVHGKFLALGDLRKDDRVIIHHHWQITKIDADRVISHTGNVVRVAYDDRSVFLSIAGQEAPVRFSLRADCRITVGEKKTPVDLLFVRVGDRLTVTHDSPELNRPQAMSLDVATQADRSTWAIVIGQGDYDNDTISPLPRATSDAGRVRDVLAEHYRVAEDQLYFKPNATRTRLEQDISQMLAQVRPEDQLIVYFVGHGYRDASGTAYLATKEFDPARMEATGMSLRWLVQKMEESQAKEKILLLDSCHDVSGADRRLQPSSAELAESLKESPSRPVSTSVIVVASCKAGQRGMSLKAGGQGAFALAVAAALTCGPNIDVDRNHRLSSGELFGAISGKLDELFVDSRRQQTPVQFLPDATPARLTIEAKEAVRALMAFMGRNANRDTMLNAFNDADDLARNEPEPKLAYGLALLNNGKTPLARDALREVLGDHPDSLLARHALAWAYFNTAGGLRDGVKHLTKLVELLPSDAKQLSPYAQHVLHFSGVLYQYALTAAERPLVRNDLKGLENAVIALGGEAIDDFKDGMNQVDAITKPIDVKIAATLDPAETRKLRGYRKRLTYYTTFDFDVAEAWIRAALEQ